MSHRFWLTCAVVTLALVLLPPALARADGFTLAVATVGNGTVSGHGYNCGTGIQNPTCSQTGWISTNRLTLAAAPGAAPGWTFSHWSFSDNFTACIDGNFSSTTVNPCVFDLPFTCLCHRNVSVTAVFVRSGQPTTSLSGGPAQGATVGPGGHSFSFSAEAGASFQCRAWRTSEVAPAMGTCSSPWPISATTDGPWRFEVRGIDTYGNVGPTASRTWTVDATAPATNLDSHPAVETIGTQARFDFSSPDGSATFQCRLDTADWGNCSSPQILTLDEGSHTFSVRARDPYGNTDDTPQTWLWEQEIPPLTTIDEGPLEGGSVELHHGKLRVPCERVGAGLRVQARRRRLGVVLVTARFLRAQRRRAHLLGPSTRRPAQPRARSARAQLDRGHCGPADRDLRGPGRGLEDQRPDSAIRLHLGPRRQFRVRVRQ